MITLVPVLASRYFQLPKEKQFIFKCANKIILPVSDYFYGCWGLEDKLIFHYGGYGSGKSFFIAADLIMKCINAPYFKCIFMRKVEKKVRDSVFETLCTQIVNMGLEHEFHFSTKPNSSMVIRHIATGNRFLPYGADNIDKLKSIAEPTHFWMEEFDQFDKRDFSLVYSRLSRTSRLHYTQLICSFNTEKVTPTHWVKESFFGTAGKNYNITKIFSNFENNEFLDRDEYRKTLMVSALGNMERYYAIAKGAWGSGAVDRPAYPMFREVHHVSEKFMKPRMDLDLILTTDNNVDPTCAIVLQYDSKARQVRILKEFRLADDTGGAHALGVEAKKWNVWNLPWQITGDAAGAYRQNNDRTTFYQTLIAAMKLPKKAVKAPRSNPGVANRIETTNMFFLYFDILINPDCRWTINDFTNVETLANGQLNKKDSTITHLSDAMGYFIVRYIPKFMTMIKKMKPRFEP